MLLWLRPATEMPQPLSSLARLLQVGVVRMPMTAIMKLRVHAHLRSFSQTCTMTKLEFDEEWYLSQYPDVRAAIQSGLLKSALEHYRRHGILEKRLPSKPVVNEAWYLRTYPDVAQAIREGRQMSAYNHFVKYGYREGRAPRPLDNKKPRSL
jgi:hypothetical protein